MELLLSVFTRLVSPEQHEMLSLINKHGGADEVRENDEALKLLLVKSSHLVEQGEDSLPPTESVVAGAPAKANKANKPMDLKTLRSELSEDLKDVLTKNLELFDRKFEIQRRQISEDQEKIIRREGDRIINAFTTGPHDRIPDPDVHDLWKEMACPGLPNKISLTNRLAGVERQCQS